jgi:hypothetical protein
MEALKKIGEFKDGVFRRNPGVPGKKNMEAYEAIWEYVTKRELVYPKPRYENPIFMDPANFDWAEVGKGVHEKLLGVFTERRTQAGFLRLDPGASHKVGGRGVYFVLDGEGRAGDKPYRRFTTVFVNADEQATLTASAATDILHYGLPDLADLSDSAFAPSRVAAE